ncbi:phosphotransferase [Alicyclobacillus cycloheptanicus]|jgi:serine/threonine-protein kinase|uniref:Serine/threonine-protein kinase n=1 Tax=Alicyclobacillus cycloheptanicus TaxID=1457 RepID=A0ABT9XK90_9BACL|nr:phosphotransferase [Alicyclobacillus cycloheptanicus]MDQ0190141.1 serine/threonine-protein kinase [Alicyclobacillus cycloheptanicus]WDM02604.1 phosphotransferase [Alicyclobacillus cycloheptanicus]
MLRAGDIVRTKWSGVRYQVIRPLGSGANGQVYLVRGPDGDAAMKVCDRAEDVALEWGILERVAKHSPWFPRPIQLDDDRDRPGLYFYVMESVSGEPLSDVLPRLSEREVHGVMDQMLQGLAALHRHGYSFCDLKPENVLVEAAGAVVRVRFVDIGGVTAFGRSVRQFTPFYDRAFWNLGSRRADPQYDLAAAAFALLFCLTSPPPHPLLGKTPAERQVWLDKALRRVPLAHYGTWLWALVHGRFADARAAQAGLPVPHDRGRTVAPRSHRRKPARAAGRRRQGTGQGVPGAQAVRGRPSQAVDWTEWVMWISIGTAAVVTIAVWGTLLQ